MKLLISCLLVASLLAGCTDGPCRLPGCSDGPAQGPTKPTTSCNHDVTVTYFNECGLRLSAYFIEVNPNSTFNCSAMSLLGTADVHQPITLTLHKGKIGFIVFAESDQGKCTSGKRKFEAWINCQNNSGNTAYFNTCQ